MKLTNEMIQNYKNFLITEEKSEVTIEKYIRDITALHLWLDGKDITKQELLSYKAKIYWFHFNTTTYLSAIEKNSATIVAP